MCSVSIARSDVYPPSLSAIGCGLSRVSLLLSVGRSKFEVCLEVGMTGVLGLHALVRCLELRLRGNDSSNRFSVPGLPRVEAMSS